jgi:3-phenylpropionate/trans-cinnamate dioxygenase ferredoxin component
VAPEVEGSNPFAHPIHLPHMPDFVTVAAASDLPPGQGKVVDVGARSIALFNVDGSFYAIDNTCPHRGGPLGAGFLHGAHVTCPWHNWTFDVRTGQHVLTSRVSVPRYEVRVVGGDVQVLLP